MYWYAIILYVLKGAPGAIQFVVSATPFFAAYKQRNHIFVAFCWGAPAPCHPPVKELKYP